LEAVFPLRQNTLHHTYTKYQDFKYQFGSVCNEMSNENEDIKEPFAGKFRKITRLGWRNAD